MSEVSTDDLTSAEAGFLYAAAKMGGDAGGHWEVCQVAAGPLADQLDHVGGDDDRLARRLTDAGLEGWQRRGRPDKPTPFCRVVRQAWQWIDDEDAPPVRKMMGRHLVRRSVADYGGDLSVLSPRAWDIRLLFEASGDELVGLELVVLGAVLLASIDEMAVRRRLAVILRRLPPTVRREVQVGLGAVTQMERLVARRIYEVYGGLAHQGFDTDEKLALLGLYFVVSASVLRHNGELGRLERALPEKMRHRCQKYRRTCLYSARPELSAAIARAIQPVIAAIAGEYREGQPRARSDTDENHSDDTDEQPQPAEGRDG